MPLEFMPIMRHPDFRLPWALIAPHAKQAIANHGQTLERLAERGGLSFTEAAAIMVGADAGRIRHDQEAQDRARAWLERQISSGVTGTVKTQQENPND